jgi:hypothetical protein
VEEPRKENLGNMKLIKYLMAGLTAVVVASGFALSAQADLITGMLNLGGTAVYDHPIGSATMITMFVNAHAEGENTGDFAGILENTPVAMTAPYVFNPSTPNAMLWSVAGFTFALQSTTIITQSVNGILIVGKGTISGNGFDPTPGEWSFSQQKGSGTRLSFSGTTEALPAPDGGMTLALLGAGLAGLAAFRAKFAKV